MQLETAILSDVTTRFVNLHESTSRRSLMIKYEGLPAWQAIGDLINHSFICRKDSAPTEDEGYLPMAAAFQFCGDIQLRDRAKFATTVVLHTLRQMFKGEQRKEGFVLEDLKRHVESTYPSRAFEEETLKLGLYLAKDFNVLAGHRLNPPHNTEVTWFQVGEGAIGMANPDTEWDTVMARYQPGGITVPNTDTDAGEKASYRHRGSEWERIEPLGGGGQSDVFLVRTPERTKERARCIDFLNSYPSPLTAPMEERTRVNTELAELLRAYVRPDLPAELGAMKVFKIRKEGGDQQALDRLKQEIKVLQENRPGLPKLLDSNEAGRWIVTEYFPRKTVEDNLCLYKGNPALALKAFLSLVDTVALLHDENIVHRDIKPANVFVRQDDELVLGDFGIVFVPDQPVRLTRTNESVGPHHYMPPWADVGARLESIQPNFDVYMLGKLLWCMVSGRLLLQREWFDAAENDVSLLFRHQPHAHMVNPILKNCLVQRSQDCISIHELRAMVIAFVGVIEQGGQLLQDNVPRFCHVCGHGQYKLGPCSQGNPAFTLRLWKSGGANDISSEHVRLFVCDSCGHIEFFRSPPQ